jgi:hypothetical protein
LLPASAQLPATSCLGAFWSPAASARGQSRHPGDQKPAQLAEVSYPSNPNLILGCALAAFMTCIEYPTRLDQE